MGYMRHHAIIVSGNDGYGDETMQKAHAEAKNIFPHVSEILPTPVNGYVSFFIPPDGSKEGWHDSHKGDARREMFIDFLKSLAYDDGSTSVKWVEVYFADDMDQAEVESHNHAEARITQHDGAHYQEVSNRYSTED